MLDRADIAWPLRLPPLIFLGPLVAGVLADSIFPIRVLPSEWPTEAIGLPVLAGGLAIGSWGFWALARAGTTVDPRHSTSRVVMDGPFRFTRNPLYFSLTLAYLGVSVATNALFPLVLFPGVLIVITVGVIGPEERYLEQKFPDEFGRYLAEVRRWI